MKYSTGKKLLSFVHRFVCKNLLKTKVILYLRMYTV